MLRILLVISILLTPVFSSATEWRICYGNPENMSKTSENEDNANKLAAASKMAVELNDLYNDIQFQKFEYERCRMSTNGTLYCEYIQRKMNSMIVDYRTEKSKFDSLMGSSGKYMKSKKEPCGFKLNSTEG